MLTRRELEVLQAARDAGIGSRAEMANFMAQISAESRNLTALEESFNYTRGIRQIPVRWARREGNDALENARSEAVRGRPETLAELMYGGRMGNHEPGDGFRYRGRGYIQLTGRDNYRATGQALGLELEADPDLAAVPEHAARIAVSFWTRNVPAAEREDVLAATRRLNGATNGLEHRRSQYERWHALLTPEVLADIDARRLERPRHELRQGMRGDSVRDVQQALNGLGIRDGRGRPLEPDGVFGPNTRQAVENFQLWHGLPTTGAADPGTLARLHGPRATATDPRPDDAADLARHAQIPDPGDPSHPGHAMYQRIRSGLQAIHATGGKSWDEASERVARCLLVRCRGADAGPGTGAPPERDPGLQRVDHVVMGTSGKVFAIEGRLDDPAQRRAWVSLDDAARVPVEVSDRQLAMPLSGSVRQQEPVRHPATPLHSTP